ncbi:MAG: ORC1-type DNA replication protein [Candidatus Woesearchaeota archaeon]|nr:ORC1-type DNA replication protein [Candidatus Woesearchaeota archaeon]
MTQKNLDNFFENYLKKESFFIEKKALQSAYTPDNIPHRDEHIQNMAEIMAPCLKLEKPSNMFIYGKTGTGKTVSVKYIRNKLENIAKKKKIDVKFIYINCKLKRVADTEYRLIAQLARELGKSIPPTGLPTDEVYKIFFNAIEEVKSLVILMLDEIDQLVKKAGDGILYNLTRLNSELKDSQISVIGISNDLTFTDHLDPRIKSSLSEEEIVFPPYNALQIQDILNQRKEVAFKPGVIGPGVIEKCSAYAAREHGDARRALELIRVAAEIAERKNLDKVSLEHIDKAEEKIERDRILDLVKTQPKQFQATLYSIILRCSKKDKNMLTGEVYEYYKSICLKVGMRPLTQRRISDIIAELDMLGIINAKVISKGRYGRTREISLAVPYSTIPKIKKILQQDLDL